MTGGRKTEERTAADAELETGELDVLEDWRRTHHCGELRAGNAGGTGSPGTCRAPAMQVNTDPIQEE